MTCHATLQTVDGIVECDVPLNHHAADKDGNAFHASPSGAIWTDGSYGACNASPSLSGSEAYRKAVAALNEAERVKHGIAHTDYLREALAYATLAAAAASTLAVLREITSTERTSWIDAMGVGQ